jgi:hypothetical protein
MPRVRFSAASPGHHRQNRWFAGRTYLELAGQLLGGFVHAWRAQYLGPEAAARDHADMQVNAPHRVAFHWHDDGRPLPVDEVRAMYYAVYRRQIRARAGLPAVGPGDEG